MASTLKALYGTANQPITITFTSLSSSSYRQSAAVDNSTDLFLDVLITVKAKAAGSGVSASGTVQIFAYGSTDATSFDGSCTGSDAAYTPPSTPPNLAYLGTLNLTAVSITDQRTFSLAQAFGGTVPTKWGIVIYNNTGQAIDNSVASAWYQGVQAQTV